MHRPLKAETTRPPGTNLRAQQQKFNHFRDEFNHERPHEALDMRTPAACDEPSPQAMPHKLPPLAYPDRFEVHDVSANGGIRWNRQWVNVSTTCAGGYMSVSRKSMRASGMSPSAPSNSVGCSNAICSSKMLMVD
jgi:putative transposase